MARFDKYTKGEEEVETKKEITEVTKKAIPSLIDIMKEESNFFKYSAILGKYFFYIKPLKDISIKIGRKLFGKFPNYKKDSPEELEIVAGLTGLFYFSIILLILVVLGKNKTGALIMLFIGVSTTLLNFNTIRRLLSLGEAGAVPISSQEVLSFLVWMVLLMEAGMNLFNAIEYYVSTEKTNLSSLMSEYIKGVKTGEKSLDEAIGKLSLEVQRSDLREILTLTLQSKQQGTPIKDTLYSYFEHYQADLLSIAESRGASANQKATFLLTGEVFLLMIFFLIAMAGSFSLF